MRKNEKILETFPRRTTCFLNKEFLFEVFIPYLKQRHQRRIN